VLLVADVRHLITVNDQPLPRSAGSRRRDSVIADASGVRALGADVRWMAATQTVIGTLIDRTVRMQIENHTAHVNDQPVLLDVPAQLIAARLCPSALPIRSAGGRQ
jgi:hypothetical protein